MYSKFGQFIDGKWQASEKKETYDVINPATEEIIGKASKASPADVDKALKSAEKGFKIWKKFSPWDRAAIIRKIADLMRKKNKLPAEKYSEEFELEYGRATIEVHKDSIKKDEKVLIIDDLIATGGTAEAAAKLIEVSNGKVAGFIFVINLFDVGGFEKLIKKNYKVENLIEFPGH